MLTEGVKHTRLRAPFGQTYPLVQFEQPLLSHRDTRKAQPPRWVGSFFAAGSLVGLTFIGLRRLQRRYPWFAIVYALWLGLIGVIVGLFGLALLSLWAFTDHVVAFRNQNLLVLSPFALLLPWYAVRHRAGLRGLALGLVLSAVLALVMKVLPYEQQDNGNLIALMLPCWLGLFVSRRACCPSLR
jgi:FtsH-binding integral membrane protein